MTKMRRDKAKKKSRMPVNVRVRMQLVRTLLRRDISLASNLTIDGSVDPKCDHMIYNNVDFK